MQSSVENSLVEEQLVTARRVWRRFCQSHHVWDPDNLWGECQLYLVSVVREFEPDKNIDLPAWVWKRLWWKMLDHLTREKHFNPFKREADLAKAHRLEEGHIPYSSKEFSEALESLREADVEAWIHAHRLLETPEDLIAEWLGWTRALVNKRFHIALRLRGVEELNQVLLDSGICGGQS